MDLSLEYFNKWYALLTNFALEETLEPAILSSITNNNSKEYITQLNNQLKEGSSYRGTWSSYRF